MGISNECVALNETEIITWMEADWERMMVWVVWVHVHTVKLANGNEIYKLRKKREAIILR